MANQHLRFEPGPAARVILDRPPVNVLTIAMLDELTAAVGEAAGHRETKALVLTGAGRAFCAGVDVADHTEDRVEFMIHAFARAVGAILDVEIPVVAVLNGAALGGGLELALACDVVLARSDAKLGQPEIRLGVFPPAAAVLLPRRVGTLRALDLILTGRSIAAKEAMGMGLVTATAPAGELADLVDGYLAQLTGLSRPVLALAKRAVLEGLERPVADALEHADRLYLGDLMDLNDPHEGLAAFVEKRAPVWSDS